MSQNNNLIAVVEKSFCLRNHSVTDKMTENNDTYRNIPCPNTWLKKKRKENVLQIL